MSARKAGAKIPGMDGFRLGRLAGIDIVIHWSWFLIFVLLAWSLAEGLFRRDYPNWTTAQIWLAGGATSLLLFGSVLLHEFAHAVMARRQGIPVSSITLFIFGGVSSLTEEPRHPRQEFLIAVVGPVTSFVLAGVFGLVGLALRGSGVGSAALYLAFINTLLGLFNLLPGFPLDGGRLLRAVSWARSGSLLRATQIASAGGTVVAFLLMAGGAVAMLLGGFLSGIWFFVIGWFLLSQTRASYRQVVARDVLEGVPVTVALRRDVHPVPPHLSLSTLSDYVLAYNQRCYPVMSGDQLLGLVSLSDLEKYPRSQWRARTVSEAMTPWDRLQVVQPSDDLAKAARLMASTDVHQLPVMEDGRFAGFVLRSDIVHLVQIRSEVGRSAPPPRPQDPVGVGR
jgi:Zn-dependent protease/CBS domain-containing protein